MSLFSVSRSPRLFVLSLAVGLVACGSHASAPVPVPIPVAVPQLADAACSFSPMPDAFPVCTSDRSCPVVTAGALQCTDGSKQTIATAPDGTTYYGDLTEHADLSPSFRLFTIPRAGASVKDQDVFPVTGDDLFERPAPTLVGATADGPTVFARSQGAAVFATKRAGAWKITPLGAPDDVRNAVLAPDGSARILSQYDDTTVGGQSWCRLLTGGPGGAWTGPKLDGACIPHSPLLVDATGGAYFNRNDDQWNAVSNGMPSTLTLQAPAGADYAFGVVAAPGLGAGTVVIGSSIDPQRPGSVYDPTSLMSQTVTVHAYVRTSDGWADVVDSFSSPYAEVLLVSDQPGNSPEYFPTKEPELVGGTVARASDGSVWLAYVKNRLDVTYDANHPYLIPAVDRSVTSLVVVQIPTDGSTVPTRRWETDIGNYNGRVGGIVLSANGAWLSIAAATVDATLLYVLDTRRF
jgi:hypothetical protein